MVYVTNHVSGGCKARTHQLLLQNRDLIGHMNQILGRLQEMKLRYSTSRGRPRNLKDIKVGDIVIMLICGFGSVVRMFP
ncbi:hypothetical protein DPMN_154714 [Dreissena polymorpha]|uniref:Uncharacterized protein n=1 Tax=Dreissena polymorpha TaxID=45954 RepID=A0A9D4FLM6_DREPO|nr:hypothetical protein DPMN_154714 [Dreissena polymorpha]